MKVIIIEDEEAASLRLKKLLLEIDTTIEVQAVLDSIEHAVPWLESHQNIDLIFADIQLADGPSFEIFNRVKISVPVIFTTAYDAYALQAFKFNGIDYLLKPIKKPDLEQGIRKFSQLRNAGPQPQVNYSELISILTSKRSSFQKRIVARIGQSIRTIEISDVAYFFTEEKIAFACLSDGKRMPLDFTLDELEAILDPSLFFRINRQFIICINAIESMFTYSKSRIKVILQPHNEGETIVSSERSAAFKEWLLGKS
jgi:DNA-binding LytR/AlgR family response regulator